MRKLSAVFLFASFFFLNVFYADAQPPDITFISSRAGFEDYLNGKPSEGIAISAEYYNSETGRIRDYLDSLIKIYIDAPFHPVFIYGKSSVRELAVKFFGENTAGCDPMIYAGLAKTASSPLTMCSASDEEITEIRFQEMILQHWQDAKELRKQYKNLG